MLLTLRTTHQPALDLGYLLHKHPEKLHTVELSFGKAHVFYPEQTNDLCEVCLFVEVDTLGLRGSRDTSDDHPLSHYVNDRAYAASSFLSVAIAKVFGTAMSGRSQMRQELADLKIPFEAKITALPSRGGPEWIKRLFSPLGYEVEVTRYALDPSFPEWGESPYCNVTLKANVRLQDLLRHLYVLIPVLDYDKHYWVGPAEVDKLLKNGASWLSVHPEHDFITSRYLKSIHSLKRDALARLEASDFETDHEADAIDSPEAQATATAPSALPQNAKRAPSEDELERPLRLNDLRLGCVKEALLETAPKRLLDLGCGEGKLLRALASAPGVTEVVGMDVSHRSLEMAKDRLSDLPPMLREKISLLHGSLTYRDSRLSGFDGAALVEVIEHLDFARLEALERVVFQFARPKRVVVTTPNQEFNQRLPGLKPGQMRHKDHRFEWTRLEFQTWSKRIASTFVYEVEFRDIGELDPDLGAPTQMAVFSL